MGNLVTLIFTIAGLIFATLGFAWGDPWLDCVEQLWGWSGIGWAGIGISVVSAFRQYRESRSFTYDFTESDWKPLGGDQSVLEIPKSEHKKGSTPASTTVYWPTDSGGYEIIHCGRDVTSSGTVRIMIAVKPFSGRVVIK